MLGDVKNSLIVSSRLQPRVLLENEKRQRRFIIKVYLMARLHR